MLFKLTQNGMTKGSNSITAVTFKKHVKTVVILLWLNATFHLSQLYVYNNRVCVVQYPCKDEDRFILPQHQNKYR